MFENNKPDLRWEDPNHPQDNDINQRPTAVVNWYKLIKWIFEDGLVTESKVLDHKELIERLINKEHALNHEERGLEWKLYEGQEDQIKKLFPMDKIYKIYSNKIYC